MTKPFSTFDKTIKRAVALTDLHELGEDAGGSNDDLLRSATVLSVAAMDHYFTSKFCDILASYLDNNEPSKELLEILHRAGLNTREALVLARMKRPFRRIRTLVQSSLSTYTSHRTKKIDALFASIDLPGLCGRAQKQSKRANIIKRVETLVDRRNEIAHSGHLNAHGNTKAIKRDDTLKRISDLSLFVTECEAIVNSWVKAKPELTPKDTG